MKAGTVRYQSLSWTDINLPTATESRIQRYSEANAQHGLELARIQPVIDLLNMQKPIPEDFDIDVNFQISITRNTAWESAQITDVLRYLPYEKVQKLAAVYSLQDLYRNQTMQIFNYQGNVAVIAATTEVQLRSASQRLLNIYAIEQALQKAYALSISN